MKKKILIGLGILVLVVGLVIGGLYYFNNKKGNEKFSYLILKINPELILSLNESNTVIDIKPLNDDAKIFKSEDLIGLDLENAISKVIDVALANGYLEDGILDIIGMSNFTGFSIEQAKTFVNNKGIVANDTSDLLDFNIDCDHTSVDAELTICNAYAVTAQQRMLEQKAIQQKKYECNANPDMWNTEECKPYIEEPTKQSEKKYVLCPEGTELSKAEPGMYFGIDSNNRKWCFACPEGSIANEEEQSCRPQ